MSHRMKTALIVMAVLCAVPVLADQNAPPVKENGPADDGDRRDAVLSDEELHDMVSTILMVRVSRSLDLTDEQTVILVKHMQEMRDRISALYEQRDEAMKSLRALEGKEGVTDDELNAKLNELVTIDEKRSAAKREAFEKVAADLTAKQKAKLYITLQDFEGQMRRMMARAKEMGDDKLRAKFEGWDRSDGPHGPADRSAAKQFMKNRRNSAGAGGDAAPKGQAVEKPEETKAP